MKAANAPAEVLTLRPRAARSESHTASADAKPETVAFAWEDLGAILREVVPLATRHAYEVPRQEAFEPDWERYIQYQAMGVMHVLTARSGGHLVGYVMLFIGPHIHYAHTVWANISDPYLDPLYRSGWTGMRMLREAEKRAKQLGAKFVDFAENTAYSNPSGRRLGVALKRLGYEPRDTIWTKRLGHA